MAMTAPQSFSSRAKPATARASKRPVQKVARPDINLVVGSVLHRLRVSAGQSQTTVAKAIGLTFQQIQKYERGTNKISLANLILLSEYFNVPLSTFTQAALDAHNGTMTEGDLDTIKQPTSRIRLELGREISLVRDETLLKPILDLLRTLNGPDLYR